MNRSLLPIACLLGAIAACGKDSGPAGLEAPQFAKFDLVGNWSGMAEQFRWKDNWFFLNDRTPMVDSLIVNLKIDDDTYNLEVNHSDNRVELTFLEEGRWSWFKESREFLFFDALKENFKEILKNPGSQSSNTLSWRENPGEKRSWKCNFEYDPVKQTIKLFNFDNLYDYGSIVLRKY